MRAGAGFAAAADRSARVDSRQRLGRRAGRTSNDVRGGRPRQQRPVAADRRADRARAAAACTNGGHRSSRHVRAASSASRRHRAGRAPPAAPATSRRVSRSPRAASSTSRSALPRTRAARSAAPRRSAAPGLGCSPDGRSGTRRRPDVEQRVAGDVRAARDRTRQRSTSGSISLDRPEPAEAPRSGRSRTSASLVVERRERAAGTACSDAHVAERERGRGAPPRAPAREAPSARWSHGPVASK